MYFWTFGLRKTLLNKYLKITLLNKYLKITVSEDPSTSNMVKGLKHCWNLDDSTFTIFIDHRENSLVGKSLS